ncbi:unnamed protein product [Vicia faba]|uniref:Uncharacterized protein n=1 Tax=Vicia faba TaxID=3906 RepID=A0AAV1AM83_VICFA|nr:unnamed protein product [Vicia faba]
MKLALQVTKSGIYLGGSKSWFNDNCTKRIVVPWKGETAKSYIGDIVNVPSSGLRPSLFSRGWKKIPRLKRFMIYVKTPLWGLGLSGLIAFAPTYHYHAGVVAFFVSLCAGKANIDILNANPGIPNSGKKDA